MYQRVPDPPPVLKEVAALVIDKLERHLTPVCVVCSTEAYAELKATSPCGCLPKLEMPPGFIFIRQEEKQTIRFRVEVLN